MEALIIIVAVFAFAVLPVTALAIGIYSVCTKSDKKCHGGGGYAFEVPPDSLQLEPWYKYPMDSYMHPTQPPVDVHIHHEPQSSLLDDAAGLIGSTVKDIFGI